MPLLERLSKTAATLSVLLIVLLLLAVHPDVTWTLRAITVAALIAGWLTARPSHPSIHIWIGVAPLVPAFLRLLAGREGPVLDFVWMAGLAGGLLRLTPWSRWTLPSPWAVLIGGWTLVLSLSWPVLVAREAGFHLAGLTDAGAINSWALMSAPQVVGWILYVVLSQLLAALCFEWLRGAFADPSERPRVIHAMWIGVTLASLVAIAQGTVDLRLLSTDFWAALRRTTGTMLDANSYGLLAALAAPIALLSVRTSLPNMPSAAVLAFAVNWVGMWMSGSRTALICGITGTTGLVIGLWRSRRSTTQQTRATAMTWALITIAVIVIVVAGTVSPVRRALEVPAGRAGLTALWNRGGYGPIALRMTQDYPLTGVGVGSYRIMAPDYWRAMSNDALQLDNAQNWWRHQIAEMGVFGAAFIVGFSVLLAWRVVTGRAVPLEAAASWTTRGLLAGIAAASLFGVPTQNPVVLLWFFALIAWFLSTLTPDVRAPGERRGEHDGLVWAAAGVLAMAYAGGHLLLATGPLGVAARAQDARREYVAGAYPPEPLPNANEFRWTRQDTQFVWPAKTRWLVVRLWAHHPDIGTRPVHVTLRSSCGVLFDEDLKTADPLGIGVTLPEDQSAVTATVHVSRTWKPSDHGEPDERDLGVGIVADFVADPALAKAQNRTPAVSGCGPGI